MPDLNGPTPYEELARHWPRMLPSVCWPKLGVNVRRGDGPDSALVGLGPRRGGERNQIAQRVGQDLGPCGRQRLLTSVAHR